MSLEQLISTYGYAAVGIGTFLEGETILVLGGFAAHRGYLELPWVIISAFAGTLVGDQLFFYIGRIQGKAFLDRRPHWKRKSEKAFLLLHNHQTWFMLGFRFAYGMRTISPFILGAAGISPLRFLVFNILGAFAWATVVGVLGYLFGSTLDLLLGDIKEFELLIFTVLAGIGVVTWLIYLRKQLPPKKQ
jgi:membrane protein DedA with SNARE-associated domain